MFPHFPFMFFLLCSLLSSSLCSHLFWYSQLFLLPFFLLYCQLLKFLHHQCFSFVIPHCLTPLLILPLLSLAFIYFYLLPFPSTSPTVQSGCCLFEVRAYWAQVWGEHSYVDTTHTHRNTRTHRYKHLLFLSLFFYQRCLTHRDWSGCTHTHTAQSSIKGVYRSLPAAVVLVWFLHCFLFQLIHLCLWPQHTYKYSHTRTDTYSQIYTQIHTPLQHY